MTRYLYLLTVSALLLCSCGKENTTTGHQKLYTWCKNNLSKSPKEVSAKIAEHKKDLNDLYWFAKFEYLQAAIELRSGHNIVGLRRSIQSLQILKEIDSEDLVLYYGLTRNIAAMQVNLGDYENAVVTYNESIDLAEQIGRPQLTIDYARLHLAVAKTNTDDFQEGMQELLALYNDSSKPVRMAAALELGMKNRDIDDFDKAIDTYFQYVINEDAENSNYGNPELEIAKTYVQMNDNAKAVEYFKKALPKMSNNEGKFKVLFEKGLMHLEAGERDEALNDLSNSLDYWVFGEKMKFIHVYDYLSDASNGEQSIAYKEKYRELRDLQSRNLVESTRQASIRATEFQAESIRLITLQKKQRNELLLQRLVLTGIVLLLAGLVIWQFRRRASDRKDKEMKIQQAFALIREVEHTK